ncbi:MAG: GyrI-like domain-containing protein [Notoacmeibacter sp.]|nr:GyrI-like domain-containing protein [Notoacmeibacter sp.]
MLPVTETAFDGAHLSVPQVVARKAASYAAIPVTGPMADLPDFAPPKFDTLYGWLGEKNIAGNAGFFRYRGFSADSGVDMEVGVFVDLPIVGDGPVIGAQLPSGRYISAIYTGPYDRLYDAFCMVSGWLHGRGLSADESCRGGGRFPACQVEIYRVTPGDTPDPARWQTEILLKLAD